VTYTPEGGLNTTHVTKFDELLIKVKAQTSSCVGLKGEEFDLCFTKGIAEDVIKMENKRDEVVKYRDLMSGRLRNYTCADESMNSSKPLSSKTVYINNDIKYKLDILFDSPAAKIWVIENFITPEECQILYDHGKPRLRRATVAGEDGRSLVSESRKAQQASYNLVDNNPNDPLRGLKERVLSITNHHAGYDLQPDGQEDFTIIQYNKADEYVPHCDGNCDGSPYKLGGRVATAVMYCQAATKGGGTTFTKADVYVKPKPGMATFFSYKGPDGMMEDGFTEHSGCPVLEGEKWITTAWMREGVSLEAPSTVFDPSGMRIDNLDPMDREEGDGDEEEEEAEEVSKSQNFL
jgi:2OG-Fe(II) oxygenase superfamily